MKKKNIYRVRALLAVMLASQQALSLELGFSDVWNAVKKNALSIQSAESSLKAEGIGADRANRHWYPELYTEAKSYYTDDPGASLFAKLGERNITGSDFSPTIMNYPSIARHETAVLGAQWMLYEGGAKLAQSTALQLGVDSKSSQKKAVEVSEYSQVVGSYGQMIILERKKRALLPLKELVEGTLAHYQIGQSTNPLGYSGRLGLKNIQLRLDGELSMLDSQQKSIEVNLKQTANLPAEWAPKQKTLQELFIAHVDPGLKNPGEESFDVRAGKKSAESIRSLAEAEKARFLPQVGIFAQQNLYNNSETNFANSKTYGVFMRWQLFSAGNFGAVSQARAQAQAIELGAEQKSRQQKAQFAMSMVSIEALNEQVKRADESLKLLEEQSLVSRKLFTNGLINALQLVEVYSRRVDVISARSDLEMNLLNQKTQMINNLPFYIEGI